MKNLFAFALLFGLFACTAPTPSPDLTPTRPSTVPPPTPIDLTPEGLPRATTARPTATLTPTAPNEMTFALLLATSSRDEHSQALRRSFITQAQTQGANVTVQFADNDETRQRAQFDDALARRVNVIVITPVDADSAAPLVAAAHKANVKVIALDEPIRSAEVDLLVAMDFFDAGKKQAQRAVESLQTNKRIPPWNFAILEKRAGDLSARELVKGYYAALAPYIDKQQLRIAADVAHKSNLSTAAITTTLRALSDTVSLNAILANSPELARGALLALDQAHVSTPVYVSSAALDADALRALCNERLHFATLAPYPALGQTAARAALSFVETGTVRTEQIFEIGDKPVPAILLAAQEITTETIHAYAVQSGIYAYEQTTNCLPPVAKGARLPQISARASLQLWTDEVENDTYAYLANLIAQFHQVNPQVHITLTSFISDSLAPEWLHARADGRPDLVFASIRPVLTATRDLLQPVDTQIDVSKFVTDAVRAAQVSSRTLGVPTSYGGHLLLFYNKSFVAEPPRTTDDLFRLASSTSRSETRPYEFTLAFDQQDARYLTPWFLALGGEFFATRSVTSTVPIVATPTLTPTVALTIGVGLAPSLNTRAMSDTLAFLADLHAKKVVPPEGDSQLTDALFVDGRAAMVISGEWNIVKYRAALGDKLGLARLPTLSARNPLAFTEGRYFYVPQNLNGDNLIAAKAFIEFVTSKAVQIEMAQKFYRLPALLEALNDSAVTDDALLRASLDALRLAILKPPNFSPCLEEAIRSQMPAAFRGDIKPADAARAMQERAERCLSERK